jgi:hypothetical protein
MFHTHTLSLTHANRYANNSTAVFLRIGMTESLPDNSIVSDLAKGYITPKPQNPLKMKNI